MEYDDAQARKDVSENFPNMIVHYVFILKKGSIWTADETPEIDALQEAHLANYPRLDELGKLVISGPFLDAFATSGDVRGMGVLRADALDQAYELISTDPMVKVGRLIFELHPWMVDRNVLP